MAASGLTYLQIVNRVLERLRESSVAAYNTNDYSSFIAGLVNQVKTEIEEAWYWHALRETFTVSATVGVVSYALTGSRMNAVIISGWNTTTGRKLERGTIGGFDSKFFGVSSVQTGGPEQWLPTGFDANYDCTLDVWPQPDTSYTLKFNVYVPQADLAADATVPLVPQNVLIEETIARALVERGEEGAQPPMPGQRFICADLLAAAVSRDQGRTDDTEMDWEPE